MKRNLHLSTTLKKGFLFLTMVTMIVACASPKKVMEDGRYDDAVRLAIKRIKGKAEPKLKHVLVLEEAYRKAHSRDLDQIAYLKGANRDENWPKIYRIYRNIEDRQRAIDPFIPLYADNGYLAEFGLVKVAPLLVEAKERTADYYYDAARVRLEAARNGDKYAAREALRFLEKIDPLFRNYKDVDRWKAVAVELGTEYWLISLKNKSGAIMPPFFERDLLSIGGRDLDERWTKFYTKPVEGIKYDYEVALAIHGLDVSPEVAKERQFDESKEMEDGFEYVLDANGNVMKDSLGNDIKVPRYTWISATVLEIHQVKTAEVRGRLTIEDLVEGRIIHSEPVNAGHRFENYASTMVRGDRRALKRETKNSLGNGPIPFPTDEAMLLSTMEALKDELSRFLRGPHV